MLLAVLNIDDLDFMYVMRFLVSTEDVLAAIAFGLLLLIVPTDLLLLNAPTGLFWRRYEDVMKLVVLNV